MICHVYFNMVSYNIEISENTSKLCILIFILGNTAAKLYQWFLETHHIFSNIQ